MITNVYIAKNVYGGDGLGRLGDGRVVFVSGAWAGEQVRAEIFEEKRHFVKARLVEVVDASPERVPCGPQALPGMVYATLSDAGEDKVKELQLQEFFDRARITVPAMIHSPVARTLNYRNKVVYHFARQSGRWVIGYRLEPSHEIVDVVSDPLARPEINAKLPEIRRTVLTLLTTGPQSVQRDTAAKANLTVRWTRKSGVQWWLGEAPKGLVLKETTAGFDFEVPAGGFYQVNPEVGDALVRAVVNRLKGSDDRLLDLYCGVGVFGLAARAAGAGSSLLGIESGRQAVDFARRNAAALGQTDARFFAEEVGRNLRRIPIGRNTTVIVDPPRDGLERGVAKWLLNSGANRILYVSCDPATLMRDLRELTKGYAVQDVEWFNLFPRTARFETLVDLKRA